MVLLLLSWGSWLTLVHVKFADHVATAPRRHGPFISILKPLKGLHEGLPENLESFFLQDYRDFEILFSVADANDAVIPVIRALQQKYPDVHAELLVGDVKVGANPKVNNLVRAYASAKADLLLISDSNIRVTPGYLRNVVQALKPDTGVVTALIAGRNAQGSGGMLETLHLNTFCTRGMLLASFFGRPCVLGKSMLIRRSTLERFGGMGVLGQYLAEDYMTAEAMHHLGLKVSLMTEPVGQHIGPYRFEQFWSRHVRWGRIRKCHAPMVFMFELASSPVIAAGLGAFGLWKLGGVSPLDFWAAYLALAFVCDAMMMEALGERIGLRTPLVWLAREIIWIPLWLTIAANNEIAWQGNRLTLHAGGLVKKAA